MQVVDVRGSGEVAAAPLGVAGAVNIPLDALREEASGLRRDVPTVMVCAVGKRGYFGARVLRGLGFEDVRVLSGGQAIRARLRR
jgi:rhodanese-related sulfurtransferase